MPVAVPPAVTVATEPPRRGIGSKRAAARRYYDAEIGPTDGRGATELGSLLAVPPNYTFNVVASGEDDVVTGFHDVTDSPLWINGGFFVFDRRVFDYVRDGDDMPEILGRLIADRELLAIKYDGFWSPMDTLKDRERLEGLVRDGRSGWPVWPSTRAS